MKIIRNIYIRTVNWGDCDPAGIVFYPNFYKWMDEAHWLFFEQIGLSIVNLKKKYKIVGLPLIKTSAIYYIPCKQGDQLEIEIRLIELKNSSLKLQHIIKKNKKVASIGFESRVWAKKEGDIVAPEQIPSAVRNKLINFVKDEEII